MALWVLCEYNDADLLFDWVIVLVCFTRRCNSNVGALWTRPSELSLGSRCGLVSIATHELGHLLGFGHEQNRPDRDQYIDILWENVRPGNI